MFEQIQHPNRGVFVLYGTHLWGPPVIYTHSSCLCWCYVDASHSHFVVDQLWTALTVSCSPRNPLGPILFVLAISRGKGLCIPPSWFSLSFFVFPTLILLLIVPSLSPHWCQLGVPFFLLAFQRLSWGNSSPGRVKALKDGAICTHGFNRLWQWFVWVQRRADILLSTAVFKPNIHKLWRKRDDGRGPVFWPHETVGATFALLLSGCERI